VNFWAAAGWHGNMYRLVIDLQPTPWNRDGVERQMVFASICTPLSSTRLSETEQRKVSW